MISWIQRYFQRHFRTVFLVLLAITIVSFIFAFNASSGFGRADRTAVRRPFFGYNLGSEADQRRLFGDAQLSATLQMGQSIGQDATINYELQRTAALNLADQLHLPAATPDQIAEKIKKMGMFADQTGQFDAAAYANFRNRLKQGGGVSEADIARVLGDDVRFDAVTKLLGGSGYALAEEVRTQLERADTTWTVATATIELADFKPEIKVTELELTKFFQDNALKYEVPAQVVATAVNFPAASYLGAVNLTEADVRSFYDQNPARYAPPTPAEAGKAPLPPKPDPAADYARARPQVELDLKLERARPLAVKAASDFVYSLYTTKVAPGPALENALAAQHLTASPLAPFTREKGPAEFGGSQEVAEAAFKLDATRFYSEALATPQGATVLFWKNILPARTPAFAEVRDRVAKDYDEVEKRRRFLVLGQSVHAQIEAQLKASEPWDKAVAAAATSAGVKIDAKTLPPYSPRTRPAGLDYAAASVVERLAKGQVSPLQMSGDKGVYVYVLDKKAPDASPKNAQFIETQNQLATMGSRVTSSAVLGEMVERELKRGEPKQP